VARLPGLPVTWFTFLILSFVTYRVTHLIVMDTLFEGMRDRLLDKLTTGEGTDGETHVIDKHRDPKAWEKLPIWRTKIFDLITCPFCMGVWVAGGTVILHDAFVDPNLPMPVWYWVGLSTAMLVWWAIIDGHD
jgi:hypothetical protein